MTSAMANKLLHGPLTSLKHSAGEADGAALIAATRALFALDAPTERAHEEAREEEARSPTIAAPKAG